MKTLDKGQDKIKKIAEGIRIEVLEPSKKEAERIIEEAHHKADNLIKEAEKQAQKIIENAKVAVEHERNVFLSSLAQASKQTIESLKQSIETKFFNEELESLVSKETVDPKVIAHLITAIIKAVEKEGTSTNIAALIPKTVSVDEVNVLLGKQILDKLHQQTVAVGGFSGGVRVKLTDKSLTLEMTDETLADYLRSYLRKDFRKLIFAD